MSSEPVLRRDSRIQARPPLTLDVSRRQRPGIDIRQPREAAEQKSIADQTHTGMGHIETKQAVDLLEGQVMARNLLVAELVVGKGVTGEVSLAGGQPENVLEGDQVDPYGVFLVPAHAGHEVVEPDQEAAVDARQRQVLTPVVVRDEALQVAVDTAVFISRQAAVDSHHTVKLRVVLAEKIQQVLRRAVAPEK